MRVIGRLKGEGFLLIDEGEPTGPVGYEIEIQDTMAGSRGGFGHLEATMVDAFDAFSSKNLKLRLASGDDVDIVTPTFSPSGTVKFKTSGRIPGF